jgi:hypothetical protein
MTPIGHAGDLDLLLVNPGNRVRAYQSLGTSLSAIEPPVWAGLIATFVRRHGYSVSILDANAENLGPGETAEKIAERAPALTAVVAYGHNPSAATSVMPAAGAICSSLKRIRPDLKILLAGGHVAALPGRTLREEETDFVCGGEGPQTVLELLQALKSGNSPDYGKVRGLWYRDGEELRAAPPAPLVMNLDGEMPGVAWDLLPMDRYRAHNWHCFGEPSRQPYAAFYTTLGCPFPQAGTGIPSTPSTRFLFRRDMFRAGRFFDSGTKRFKPISAPHVIWR